MYRESNGEQGAAADVGGHLGISDFKAPLAPNAAKLHRSAAEGAPMFCEQCAPLTRTLTFDPAVEPRAELMSGSCMWADEIHRGWCIQCVWKTREVFHLRHQITVGDPVPPASVAFFGVLEHQFPNWPLFRPERRSPEIAERMRQMVRRNMRQACVDLERMDREYRKRQAEGQAPDAEPGAAADSGAR